MVKLKCEGKNGNPICYLLRMCRTKYQFRLDEHITFNTGLTEIRNSNDYMPSNSVLSSQFI